MSDYKAKTDWKYDDPVTEMDLNRIEQGIKDAHEKAGKLDELDTQEKTDLVAAINELKSQIGNLTNLETEEKVSLVSSVNEIHRMVSEHKAESVYDANGVHGYKIEEGTFTPYFTGANDYRFQTGHYIRQGKIVTVTGTIGLNSKSGLDSSANVIIRGLPFVAEQDYSAIISKPDLILFGSDTKMVTSDIIKDTSVIGLYRSREGFGAASLTFADVGNTFGITFTATYKIKGA